MSRSFFDNTSHCSFQGNMITNIAGDYINQMVDSGSEGQIVSHGARGDSIFDEVGFTLFSICRTLKANLCASHLQYEYVQQLSEVNRGLEYHTKTTYKIDLLGRGHKEATGTLPYRIAAWERDFLQYSRQHPNLVHLYGFNREKSTPCLIFCDNVVPFMQVWENCSPIVKWHIHESFKNAVFIRCDTGEICFGSQESSKKIPSDLIYNRSTSGTSDISLPFSLYHDEAGLKQYLLRMIGQKNHPVLTPSFIRPYYSHSLTSTEVIPLPSVLDGLRQKLSGSFKNMDQSYSYTLEPWGCNYNDDNNGKVLGTGWTWFHYESDIGKGFWLHVRCSPETEQRIWNAWLHQEQHYLNVVKGDAFDAFVNKPLDYQYEAAKYLQEIQGFDPLTQDYARARGLPLFEMFSPLEDFHPNVVELDLTEKDQEVFDVWYDAEETLSNKSDSESVYEDASSQPQTILFPIPGTEQKLNGSTPEDSDLGSCKGDFSFNEESDNDPASQALRLNPSFGSALTTGCKPSSWLRAYLIQGDVESRTGFVSDVSIWVGINKE
ncbi:hypothetical protein K435DRAFT_844137 [Dendrothele bispora CBS 962.96]|uniref:Uncharacterized protein n=1 Tax=Dendrothele bispora (strain CBS 962.96) TaxID=1314807 RepID=A0A4S8L3R1_DENBC|nr:hypothetical protein K435DRAFT_844137 [Dendrothele bispora CBS 962.96]